MENKERDSKNETLKCNWYIKIEMKYRMLNIQVDERAIRRLYLEKLEEKLKELGAEFLFWDTREFLKRTCMLRITIQKEFYFDQRLQKFKVDEKWYFLAKDTKAFLLNWLTENVV
ncbi:group-specific protein [Bacillus cereus]|uniref:group-specific protein n=2 Tax=Bacillus cereus group TaxID=86661 RepID=UPI0035CCCCB9